MTQFVSVEFTPGGKPYTYRNDGEKLAVGDRVKVATAKEGEKSVTVSAVDLAKPKYECKPVLGKIEEKKADAGKS